MKDSEFKALQHRVGEYRIVSRGTEVTTGYKPDVVDVNDFIKKVFQKTQVVSQVLPGKEAMIQDSMKSIFFQKALPLSFT